MTNSVNTQTTGIVRGANKPVTKPMNTEEKYLLKVFCSLLFKLTINNFDTALYLSLIHI